MFKKTFFLIFAVCCVSGCGGSDGAQSSLFTVTSELDNWINNYIDPDQQDYFKEKIKNESNELNSLYRKAEKHEIDTNKREMEEYIISIEELQKNIENVYSFIMKDNNLEKFSSTSEHDKVELFENNFPEYKDKKNEEINNILLTMINLIDVFNKETKPYLKKNLSKEKLKQALFEYINLRKNTISSIIKRI